MEKLYGTPAFGTITEDHPRVKTTHGMIEGENRDGIAIFRGIPYGADCGGERRFLPPLPAEDWEGVRDCTKNGHYAVQMGTSIAADPYYGSFYSGGHPELFGVEGEEQGEDCLVLNVLTPGLDGKKRPVVFYIHGGGFSSNSGSMILGADKWAREEDLVLVGVNHRLTALGYMYLGAFDEKYAESGNAGMLDLVLALEWVRDNITQFGGDPDEVTIMGESGGGMKVNTLLAMEKANGLFKRAIAESGTNVVDGLSKEKATKLTKETLDRLGVSTNHLEKILEIPAEEIVKAAGGFGRDGFAPVADNINIMDKGGKLRVWKTAEQIPMMLGAAEEELALFSQGEILDISEEDVKQFLTTKREGMINQIIVTPEAADQLIADFKKIERRQMSADHIFFRIQSMGSFLGGAPWYLAVKKAEAKKALVYQYMIRKEAKHPGNPVKTYAWHTEELPWVMRIVFDPEDEKISKTMAHVWAAFARTGDPSTELLPWKPFTMEEKEVMIFDDECRMERDPEREIREALERAGISF